jgi:urease accessory protein
MIPATTSVSSPHLAVADVDAASQVLTLNTESSGGSQHAPWVGNLELGFVAFGDATHLTTNRHSGPLMVQRPFRDAHGTCQVVVLNPPGGLVGGDQLRLNAVVGPGAQALVTTPGATKFYRSGGVRSSLEQSFTIAEAGCLEWLPHETIAYDGTCARARTRVELAEGARFAGWELTCLGRPACGEGFDAGEYSGRFELWRGGRPLWLERTHVVPGSEARHSAWGFAGHAVSGSLVCFPAGATELALARAELTALELLHPEVAQGPRDRLGATLLGGTLVCRYLGASTLRGRRAFQRIWSVLREPVLGKRAIAPRIWAT